MPSQVLSSLDTSSVAEEFDDFLASQGLGDMNPSAAARYRSGVEISPMDEILAINGKNLDDLFKRNLPVPPPLSALSSRDGDKQSNRDDATGKAADAISLDDTKSVIRSLGLSEEALKTLTGLITSGGSNTVGELPASLQQLLLNPGVENGADLIKQLGELKALIGNRRLGSGEDISQTMLDLMSLLNISDSSLLLTTLRANPLGLRELLRDTLTGIAEPLGSTTTLLKAKNPFDADPIIGSSDNETLLARLAGGTRLTGGGGKDLYIIQLSSNPFAQPTVITDFDSSTGSKIVLYMEDYAINLNPRFSTSRNSREAKINAQKKIGLIYNTKSNQILVNGNRRKVGFGEGIGGTMVILENDADISYDSFAVLRDNNLYTLGGDMLTF